MSIKCNYCINKNQCSECDKSWKDKFIPSAEVEHYFRRMYSGIRGINGVTYEWDSTNANLTPTRGITIGYTKYCPYCGEKMLPIQGYLAQGIGDYRETGKCCICQGARDEIEYNLKLNELLKKHEQEMEDLKNLYREKLQFCTDKLIDMQLREITKKHDICIKYNYFSNIYDAKELIDL